MNVEEISTSLIKMMNESEYLDVNVNNGNQTFEEMDLNSIELVAVLCEVEKFFNIEFDDEQLIVSLEISVNELAKMVSEKL